MDGLPEGCLFALVEKIDLWEKFDLKNVPCMPGCYTLMSHATQKFVSADENLGNVLVANRDVPDEWEWFRIEKISFIRPKAIHKNDTKPNLSIWTRIALCSPI